MLTLSGSRSRTLQRPFARLGFSSRLVPLLVAVGTASTLVSCASTDDKAAAKPAPPIDAFVEDAQPFIPDDLPPLASTDPHAFTALDLLGFERIGAPVLSPDGQTLVYGRRTTVLDENRSRSTLWSMPSEGGPAKQLTFHPKGAGAASFSPDGRYLYFLSSRSGSSQVWRLPLEGGEPQQVSQSPIDIGDYRLSPGGETLLVTIDVFTDCPDLACTEKRLAKRAAKGESGQAYDKIFVRHWDTWKDGRLK